MAYVKGFNPGQLCLDLPSSNYYYELPLFSFGDTHGSIGVSLAFNYSEYSKANNDFLFAPGYKLNLQKKIRLNGGTPDYYVNEYGKAIGLVERVYGDATVLYTFLDKSKRVLRPTSVGYNVEYPDGSKEIFNINGGIQFFVNKYNETVLTYSYNGAGRLTSVVYYTNKIINIAYASSGRVSSVTYSSSTFELEYTANGINVTHPSGEVTVLASDGYSFSARAGEYNESNTLNIKNIIAISCNTDANTVKISDLVPDDGNEKEINNTVYKFPDDLNVNVLYNQVEVTDYYGVKNRIQYGNDVPLYSYEIGGDDVEFKDWGTMQRYTGSVQMLRGDKNTKNIHTCGAQAFKDGESMLSPVSGSKEWTYHVDDSSNAASGYYVLSGWAKVTDSYVDPQRAKIHATNSTMGSTYVLEFDLTPCNQWKYFSAIVRLEGYQIKVRPEISSDTIELRDVRLTFQHDVVEDSRGDYRLAIEEDGLIYHANGSNDFIPLSEITVICNNDSALYNEGSSVYFDDLLKNKINYKRGINKTEFYFNHVTDFISKPASEDPRITHNGNTYYLSQCYLAKRSYARYHGYVTSRIVDDSEDGFLKYETLNNSGGVISVQILNDKLDALSSTSEGVITEYTRDSSGRILSESVRNSEGSGLYTRTTAYGTDSSGNPTVMATDEYGKTSVSTLDPVWGVVTSTSLPDGSLITYEYDDGKYAMTKRLVGGNPFRSNILTYADGYTSAVQTTTCASAQDFFPYQHGP